MPDLIRLYDGPSSPAPASSNSGLIRLYPDAPAATPATPAAPSGPALSSADLPASYRSEPLYDASNKTDISGKPLETFRNDKLGMSELLTDRVYPGFDPTKPTKLDQSHLTNGRMPLEVSAPLKEQMGGAYSDELDHKIALELSGSNNPSNLQIEPGRLGGLSAAHDKLETQLAHHVVKGDISLLDGQRALARAKGYTLPEDMTRSEVATQGPVKTFPTPDVQPPVNGQATDTPAFDTAPSFKSPTDFSEARPAPSNTRALDGMDVLNAFPGTNQTLADLQMDPLSIKANPAKAITDYWHGIKDSVLAEGENIKQIFTGKGAAAKIGAGEKAAAGAVNAGISPITSLFSAANDIPVLGTVSRLITLPFAFMGDAGRDTAKVITDALPISQDAKNKIVDGMGDIIGLAGQFVVGGLAEKAIPDLVKRYGPEDTATIVDKAKEIASTEKPSEAQAAPARAPSSEPVNFPEKPLPETKAPAPAEERAGFVNPKAFTDSAKEALDTFKQTQQDSKAGEALRTYFTGESDSRVAETNQLRDQLSKGLSPKEQEALTLMRDFKNRPGELDKFANGTHQAYDKLPPDERAAAVERVQTLQPIIDLAKNPTENMKAADAAMTRYFESHLAEGKQLGFLDSKIGNDEYVSHLLQPKDDAGRVVAKGGSLRTYKIGRTTPFAKERTYQTVLHAIANGVEPRTLNALDALTIYGDKHATAAATHLLINQLKDSGVAKWGSHGSENVPSDWKPIAPENNRLFQNQVPFVDKEGKPGIAHQSLYAPPKVVDALRPLTDPDYTDRIPGFRSSRIYQAYLKSVELGLSVFHLKAMNITALGNEGVSGLVKTYATDMKSPAFLDNERAFIKAGGTSSILGRTIEAYRELQPSSIPTRMDILRGLPGFKQFDKASAAISKLTFDIVQRKMKVTDFALKDAKWIADNPTATPAEHYAAQRSLAKQINATYGGLNWESLGINKMTHSLTKAILLAPDWTFSNWMNVKGAFEGGPGGSASRAFWIRSAITGVALTQATSLLMSGKASSNPTQVYLGKDPHGKDIFQNLFFAGAPNDMVNLIGNVKDYGAIAGLGQSVLGKLAPILRTGFETATNKNYLGQDIVPKGAGPIAGTGRSIVNIGSQLGPVPFSVSNVIQMLMDPKKQYTQKEFVTTLLGGTRPRHVAPDGMRQVTTGKKKGEIVPATPRARNSTLDIIKGSPINKPIKKK
jgi:hypothetical protein